MRILIFEDEIIAFERLVILIKSVIPDVQIVGHAKSIEEGHKILRSSKEIALAFMDIQLEDGLCFTLLEKFSFEFPIIFTTAYDNYAIRAFDHHSIGYLLKPIGKFDLKTVFEKYEMHHNSGAEGYNKAMLSIIKQMQVPQYKERFTIKIGDKIRIFLTEEIIGFYSRLKGSFILTNKGKSYCINESLDSIRNQVSPNLYFRVNRKHIIKLDAIQSIASHKNFRLKVHLNVFFDEDIIVARDRTKEFREWGGFGRTVL